MRSKICFILSLCFCFIPVVCHAKSIEIDYLTYTTDSIIEKDNFTYNAIEDTLILKNANLELIRCNNNLKIILEGNNYITSPSDGIYAKKLEITGEGTLSIVANELAIMATSTKIENTTINLKSSGYNIAGVGGMIINNSKITSTCGSSIFNPVTSDVIINNSSIIINKTKNLTQDSNFYINNSNLIILECVKVAHVFKNIYVNGNSNVYIYSSNNEVPCYRYILDSNMIFLGSSDNLNYYEITDYSDKPKYIRIITKDYNNELINLQELENELNQKQNNLNELKILLEEKERLLLEKLNNLDIKEEELILYQEELNTISNTLNLEKNNLENLQEEIKIKQQELDNYQILLDKQNKDLINNNKTLEDKTNELNTKESELLNLEDKLNNKENDLVNKNEELVLYNKELINKEDNLKKQENDLKNNIQIKEEEIKMQLDNNLMEKNRLYDLENYLNTLKENIINSKQELLNKQQYLLIEQEDLEEREKLLNNKDNDLEVQEEKTKYGEVLEDDLLENVYEISNQRTSSLKNIIKTIASILVSFLSGGIAFSLFKKWRIAHE